MFPNRNRVPSIATIVAFGFIGSNALAQTISNVGTVDQSTIDDNQDESQFSTAVSVGPVSDSALQSTFTQRMAFRNTNVGAGGIAQVNKRNVAFELSFTVEDPDATGFLLRIDELMRGISGINWTSGGSGTALATGLSMVAQYDDSTDAPDTFTLIGSLVGLGTDGVQVSEPSSLAELKEREESADLGPYFGTTDFVLRFDSTFSSTTNVVFPNNAFGTGAVVYGLGPVPSGFGVTPSDLGHFLTITVAFATPCTGDVTGDGLVDLSDLNLVLANFGTDSLDGDANLDGTVDLDDLNAVLGAFGTPCD